jgi:hypothetical protein
MQKTLQAISPLGILDSTRPNIFNNKNNGQLNKFCDRYDNKNSIRECRTNEQGVSKSTLTNSMLDRSKWVAMLKQGGQIVSIKSIMKVEENREREDEKM